MAKDIFRSVMSGYRVKVVFFLEILGLSPGAKAEDCLGVPQEELGSVAHEKEA